MQRYFVLEDDNWQEDIVTIKDDNYHHIVRVMRMKEGDMITCVNHSGDVALCKLTQLTDHEAIFSIIEWKNEENELPIDVTIVQGIPKSDKFELILQKGTELGAKQFIPFAAERSVTKWNDKKFAKRLNRFQKITKEASEQSKRQVIPTVTYPKQIKELIQFAQDFDYALFAYEESAKGETYSSLPQLLNQVEPGMNILICIGPEGGFSKKEVDVFLENSWLPIRLGKRILRTETAPMYVLSSISYHLEELKSL